MTHAYVIRRTDTGRRISSGTQALEPGQDMRALAEALCRRARVEHSYYTGPLRCWVWPTLGDQPIGTPPEGAELVEYGAGLPAVSDAL